MHTCFTLSEIQVNPKLTHFVRGSCPAILLIPSLKTESLFFLTFFFRPKPPLKMIMKMKLCYTCLEFKKLNHHLALPMLERPPRAPFPRRNEGKMLKRDGSMVVVVAVLVMVEILNMWWSFLHWVQALQ